MRRIRSKDTLPELMLRREMHRLGLRFRCHSKDLPGKPDIVFRRKRVAVLVHGCFWHQHLGCIEASRPQTNSKYWSPKLARNVERDLKIEYALRNLGFETVILWECEIERDVSRAADLVKRAVERRNPALSSKGQDTLFIYSNKRSTSLSTESTRTTDRVILNRRGAAR